MEHDEKGMSMSEKEDGSGTSRRDFIRMAGLGGIAVVGGGWLAACADDAATSTTTAAGGPTTTVAGATSTSGAAPVGRLIKIGYVSPQTGPFAGFGGADEFVLEQVRAALADGVTVAGTVHPVEIVSKDSEGVPTTAASVATDLILEDEIDLMVTESTPETTNPVADTCELNGVPCVSAVTPWQPYFLGRGGDPASGEGFKWTYHYFWGLEGLIPQFIALWEKLDTNKIVGGLFPNDGDGQAFSANFPAALEGAGYTLIDPGLYENLADDYTSQIDAFINAGAEILTGVPLPPEFATFWTQAAQQGLAPKAATIAKALLFPTDVEALDGDSGDGLSSEVWWSPNHPFSSSLTGQSALQLSEAFTSATERQWTQVLGFSHSLFEVAADVFSRTTDIDDRESVLAAVVGTNLDTVIGPVTWSDPAKNPVPNVCTTQLVGGQWRLGGDFKYDMVIVDNSLAPDISTTGDFVAIGA